MHPNSSCPIAVLLKQAMGALHGDQSSDVHF